MAWQGDKNAGRFDLATYLAKTPLVAPGYVAQPGYAAPGYIAQPGYAVAPGYVAQPGYVEESGTAAAPRRVATTHHRNMYMSVPAHGSSTHIRKNGALKTGSNGGY